jgi:chromosome partitioning protein
VRRNTLTYQALIRFLHTLGIPIVATIRDSQNYVRAAELGVGVHEMKSYVAHDDIEQWRPLVDWLERPRGPQAPPGGAPQEGAAGTPEAAAQPADVREEPAVPGELPELTERAAPAAVATG